tara:strand:- start:4574 stop:4909 length:336 start_codon:yes stop_codon:yes gene_type:complete
MFAAGITGPILNFLWLRLFHFFDQAFRILVVECIYYPNFTHAFSNRDFPGYAVQTVIAGNHIYTLLFQHIFDMPYQGDVVVGIDFFHPHTFIPIHLCVHGIITLNNVVKMA